MVSRVVVAAGIAWELLMRDLGLIRPPALVLAWLSTFAWCIAPARAADEQVDAASTPPAVKAELLDDGSGIAGQADDGTEVFRVVHAAVNAGKLTIHGPVTTNKGVFYAVGGDLLRLDLDAQAVVERIFFGATITRLRVVEGGGLDVRLALHTFIESDDETLNRDWFPVFRTPSDPIFVPGDGEWGGLPLNALRPIRDVPEVVQSGLLDALPKTAAGLAALQQSLTALAARDRTNPAIFGALALVAKADGREDDVDTALATAAAIPKSTLTDRFRLCATAFAVGRDTFATATCAAAEAERAKGPARQTLIRLALNLRPLTEQIRQAVAANDVDRTLVLLEAAYSAFPTVEGAHQAWAFTADWLVAHGKPELASTWAERARVAAAKPANAASVNMFKMDHFILLWVSLHLGFLLAALIIGLRSGRRQVRSKKRPQSLSWLPRPSAFDAVVALILTVASIIGLHSVAKTLQTSTAFLTIPESLDAGIVSSPEVLLWAKTQRQTPEVLALSAYAAHALEQARLGQPPSQPAPSPQAIVDAMRSQSEQLTTGESILMISKEVPAEASGISFLLCGALLLLGHAIGRRPILGRLVSYGVVGAAPQLARVAILFSVAMAAGYFARYTAIGTMMTQLASAGAPKVFGVEDMIGTARPESVAVEVGALATEGPPAWAAAVLVIGLLLHLAFVVVDIAKWRKEAAAGQG